MALSPGSVTSPAPAIDTSVRSATAATEALQPPAERSIVHPYIALVCLPVIFVRELPDKTMFVSLVMATKGKPHHVWLGAATAFVAIMFLGGALYAWREGTTDETELAKTEASKHGVVLTGFIVIFLAVWGDLTQILTANLATKYHSPLSVGVPTNRARQRVGQQRQMDFRLEWDHDVSVRRQR